MEGLVMHRLSDALRNTGFVIKKIEEESYGRFDLPSGGEKYTGEIIIRIRPVRDEEGGRRRKGPAP